MDYRKSSGFALAFFVALVPPALANPLEQFLRNVPRIVDELQPGDQRQRRRETIRRDYQPSVRPSRGTESSMRSVYSHAQLVEIQSALNALSLDAGSEDGRLGENTREAVKRFQEARGFRVDGFLKEPERQLLMVLAAQAGTSVTVEATKSTPAPTASGAASSDTYIRAVIRRDQRALAAIGHRFKVFDGLPGEKYEEAVRSFQERNGFEATGVLNDGERAKLYALAPRVRAQDASGPKGVIHSRSMVFLIQTALNDIGLDVGKPDGLAGDGTEDAIRKFQRSHDLKETGFLLDAERELLFRAAEGELPQVERAPAPTIADTSPRTNEPTEAEATPPPKREVAKSPDASIKPDNSTNPPKKSATIPVAGSGRSQESKTSSVWTPAGPVTVTIRFSQPCGQDATLTMAGQELFASSASKLRSGLPEIGAFAISVCPDASSFKVVGNSKARIIFEGVLRRDGEWMLSTATTPVDAALAKLKMEATDGLTAGDIAPLVRELGGPTTEEGKQLEREIAGLVAEVVRSQLQSFKEDVDALPNSMASFQLADDKLAAARKTFFQAEDVVASLYAPLVADRHRLISEAVLADFRLKLDAYPTDWKDSANAIIFARKEAQAKVARIPEIVRIAADFEVARTAVLRELHAKFASDLSELPAEWDSLAVLEEHADFIAPYRDTLEPFEQYRTTIVQARQQTIAGLLAQAAIGIDTFGSAADNIEAVVNYGGELEKRFNAVGYGESFAVLGEAVAKRAAELISADNARLSRYPIEWEALSPLQKIEDVLLAHKQRLGREPASSPSLRPHINRVVDGLVEIAAARIGQLGSSIDDVAKLIVEGDAIEAKFGKHGQKGMFDRIAPAVASRINALVASTEVVFAAKEASWSKLAELQGPQELIDAYQARLDPVGLKLKSLNAGIRQLFDALEIQAIETIARSGHTLNDLDAVVTEGERIAVQFETHGDMSAADTIRSALAERLDEIVVDQMEYATAALAEAEANIYSIRHLQNLAIDYGAMAEAIPAFTDYQDKVAIRISELKTSLCQDAWKSLSALADYDRHALTIESEMVSLPDFSCRLDQRGHKLAVGNGPDADTLMLQLEVDTQPQVEVRFRRQPRLPEGYSLVAEAISESGTERPLSEKEWSELAGTLSRPVPTGIPDAAGKTECDDLAADPSDPAKVAVGVIEENLNPDAAIEACVAAVEYRPENALQRFQLARSLLAAGLPTDAKPFFEQASTDGHAASHAFLADELMMRNDASSAMSLYKLAIAGGYEPARERALAASPNVFDLLLVRDTISLKCEGFGSVISDDGQSHMDDNEQFVIEISVASEQANVSAHGYNVMAFEGRPYLAPGSGYRIFKHDDHVTFNAERIGHQGQYHPLKISYADGMFSHSQPFYFGRDEWGQEIYARATVEGFCAPVGDALAR